MKTVMKKLLSLMLVAVLLVSAVPFQASAAEADTYTVTMKIKNAADGSAVDTKTHVAVAGDQVYVGKIAAGRWGYDVVSFAANGKTYEADEAIIPEGDVTVAVYVNVAEGEEPEESKEPEIPEESKEPEIPEESKEPETSKNTSLTVVVFVADEGERKEPKQFGEHTFNDRETYTLNEAFVKESVKAVGYTVANYTWQWSGKVAYGQVNLILFPEYTPENKEKFTLTVMHNNGTSDRDYIDVLEGDNILNVLAKADLDIADDDDFDGWCFDMNCTQAVDRKDVITGDTTVYAEWKSKDQPGNPGADEDGDYEAVLRIYINGKTSSYAKSLNLSDKYTKDGKVTQSEVESIVKYYYAAADSDGLTFHGLFTTKTWNKGSYDKNDAVSSVKLDKDEKTYIYVMVKNVEVEEADSSNPKTGDMIFVPMIFMLGSAAALALETKKRYVK